MHCSICHISPLKSVSRKIDSSASSRSCHSARSFSFICWLLIHLRSFRGFWVLSRYNSQLAAIAFDMSRLCLNYIQSWSTCEWNHSSRNWLTIGRDPNFSIVRYWLKIFHTVSRIKVLFLLLFLLLIQFSEAFQIGWLRSIRPDCLNYIRSWSTCGWNHSSRNWLTVGRDPNFSIVRYWRRSFTRGLESKFSFCFCFCCLSNSLKLFR